MKTVETAQQAFDRYMEFRANNALIQHGWHDTSDGRELACALGALGSDVDDPKECPSAVMPQWLAECVPSLFDSGPFDECVEWAAEFYRELARVDGKVDDSVRVRWLALDLIPVQKLRLRGKWREDIGQLIDRVCDCVLLGDADAMEESVQDLRAAAVAAAAAAAARDAAADAATVAAAASAAYAAAAAAVDAAAAAADASAAAAAAAAYAATAAARDAAATADVGAVYDAHSEQWRANRASLLVRMREQMK